MASPQINGTPKNTQRSQQVSPPGHSRSSLLFSRPQTLFLNGFLFCREKGVHQQVISSIIRHSLQTCVPQQQSSSVRAVSKGPAQLQSSLLFQRHCPSASLSASSASFVPSLSWCCYPGILLQENLRVCFRWNLT